MISMPIIDLGAARQAMAPPSTPMTTQVTRITVPIWVW
jgi:hypothetical protein